MAFLVFSLFFVTNHCGLELSTTQRRPFPKREGFASLFVESMSNKKLFTLLFLQKG